MFDCETCGYQGKSLYYLNRHKRSDRHKKMIKCQGDQSQSESNYNLSDHSNKNGLRLKSEWTCEKCLKVYTHQSSYSRHMRECQEGMKSKYEYELEIERMKGVIEKKEMENKQLELTKELEKKDLEIKFLSKIKNQNTIEFNNDDNKKMTKQEYLDTYHSNVIDIETFTKNFKNEFGLSSEDSLTLFENYESMGISACAQGLNYFLNKSCQAQFKEIFGRDPKPGEVILPFTLSDSGMRKHMEKTKDGWKESISLENIERIIVITNDHVYRNHNKVMIIEPHERIKISNAILRKNEFNKLLQNNPDCKSIVIKR